MGAIQIADISQNRLQINVDAFNSVLDKVGNRPVAVISVNGPMRSGKSYIINHFLRYLTSTLIDEDWFSKKLASEFHWKSSSDRQTTGIQIWHEPLIIQRNGREVAILLLDTQGCFDDKTTTNENSLIFAFSCLMSSVLIYNFKNQLSEDILQFLQMFLGYGKIATSQPEYFSKLIFLIRDWECPVEFPFGYYDDNHCPNQRNFKKEKFDVSADMVPEVKVIRQEIASSFQNVACCLMPYPGHDLACYDKADNVDILFVRAVQDFVPRIFDGANLVTKKIGTEEVTGQELKQMVHNWAQVFSSAELPAVHSVADATAEVLNAAAQVESLKFYQEQMQCVYQANGMPNDGFQSLHSTIKGGAIDLYQRSKRLKNDCIQQKYLDLLIANIQREFGTLNDFNTVKLQFVEMQIAEEANRKRLADEAERRLEQIRAEQAQHHHHRRRRRRVLGIF